MSRDASDDEMQAILSMMRQENEVNEVDVANRNLLFAALQKIGIERVTVEFDGSGDSGTMEVPVAEGGKDLQKAMQSEPVPGARLYKYTQYGPGRLVQRVYDEKTPVVADLIGDVCYRLLQNNHGGWEINEGSYGTFTVHVSEKRIALEFVERVQTVITHEEEY